MERVYTVYTTVAHSPLSVVTFINVENQEPYLPISMDAFMTRKYVHSVSSYSLSGL